MVIPMRSDRTTRRRVPILELVGMLLYGVGICFAVASISLAFSKENTLNDKLRVRQKVDETKRKLIAAKTPEDQIPGLLRVDKDSVAGQTIHENLMILSFMVLISLLVACFGVSLTLWSRVRGLQLEIMKLKSGVAQARDPSTSSG